MATRLIGIGAIGYFVYLIFKKVIIGLLGLLTNDGRACCPTLLRRYWIDAVEINEDIPNYDECLSKADRKFTLAEELNCRIYGIQTMEQESYDELMKVEPK